MVVMFRLPYMKHGWGQMKGRRGNLPSATHLHFENFRLCSGHTLIVAYIFKHSKHSIGHNVPPSPQVSTFHTISALFMIEKEQGRKKVGGHVMSVDKNLVVSIF